MSLRSSPILKPNTSSGDLTAVLCANAVAEKINNNSDNKIDLFMGLSFFSIVVSGRDNIGKIFQITGRLILTANFSDEHAGHLFTCHEDLAGNLSHEHSDIIFGA